MIDERKDQQKEKRTCEETEVRMNKQEDKPCGVDKTSNKVQQKVPANNKDFESIFEDSTSNKDTRHSSHAFSRPETSPCYTSPHTSCHESPQTPVQSAEEEPPAVAEPETKEVEKKEQLKVQEKTPDTASLPLPTVACSLSHNTVSPLHTTDDIIKVAETTVEEKKTEEKRVVEMTTSEEKDDDIVPSPISAKPHPTLTLQTASVAFDSLPSPSPAPAEALSVAISLPSNTCQSTHSGDGGKKEEAKHEEKIEAVQGTQQNCAQTMHDLIGKVS